MNPDGAPAEADRWPLLCSTPGRLQLISDFQALSWNGALIPPPDFRAALEARETARARSGSGHHRHGDASTDLGWRPADAELREFLSAVFARADERGGLRLLAEEALPLECLQDCGGDWSTAFPIVRLMPGDVSWPNAARIPATAPSGDPTRVLIWCNPEGSPELPAAQAEADAARELFEAAADGDSRRFVVRYLGRRLSEGEWHAAAIESDIVLYYGHGQVIGGYPAVPTRDGPAPFFPAGPGTAQLTVFAACLAGPGLALRNRPGALLTPVCRIADRPDVYLREFLAAICAGEAAHTALARANLADAEAGDSRRFVFRLCGGMP